MAQIANTTNGISTVQDLYDLINGKVTTTSGIDKTETTTEGISQDAMNAMLQSALSSSQGLAAVSQGQRTAGGYNSTTNRMLVNDLMTRTASQIAQQNKTKTVQTVSAPVTQTIGGVSAAGVAKTAGVLGVGQLLSGGGLTDLAGALKNMGVSFGGGASSSGVTDHANFDIMPSENAAMSVADQYASYGAGKQSPDPTIVEGANTFSGDVASYQPVEAPLEEPAAEMTGFDGNSGKAEDDMVFADGGKVIKPSWAPQNFIAPGNSLSNVERSALQAIMPGYKLLSAGANALSGAINNKIASAREPNPVQFDWMMGTNTRIDGPPAPVGADLDTDFESGFADGGKVQKRQSNLSTNQFAKVIDPRTGLIGGGTGYNEDGVAQGSGSNVGTPTSAVTQSTQTINSDYGIGSSQGTTTLDTNSVGGGSGGGSSDISRGDVGNVSRLVTSIGNIAQNPGLAKLGVFGSLASSNAVNNLGGITERAMAGETTRADVGDTSRIVGSVGTLAGNVGLKNVADLGSIASSPNVGSAAMKIGDKLTGGVVSKVRNLAESVMYGDMQTGVNALASLNPISSLVNAGLSLGDTSIGKVATVGVANAMSGDSLDNYLSLRNYVGTAVGDNSEVQKAEEQARVESEAQAAADQAAAMAASTQGAGNITAPVAGVIPTAASVSGGNSNGYAYTGGADRGFGPTDQSGFGTMGGGGYGTESDGAGNLANGGEVSGPGGPVDDKISAKLSDGEFVLSADVVQAIGLDKLEALQAKYHTPAATQRLMAFGKGK